MVSTSVDVTCVNDQEVIGPDKLMNVNTHASDSKLLQDEPETRCVDVSRPRALLTPESYFIYISQYLVCELWWIECIIP